MRNAILILLVAGLVYASCTDTNDEVKPKEEEEYTPLIYSGLLFAWMDSYVQIDKAFSIINSYKLPIMEVRNYQYYSELPIDSIAYVTAYINNKTDYLNTNSTYVYVYEYKSNPIIFVEPYMLQMDSTYQNDWIKTVSELKLIDNGCNYKEMIINVPIGMEQFWIDSLKKNIFIKNIRRMAEYDK